MELCSFFCNVKNGPSPESGAKFENASTADTATADSSGPASDAIALSLRFLHHSVSVDLLDGRFPIATGVQPAFPVLELDIRIIKIAVIIRKKRPKKTPASPCSSLG